MKIQEGILRKILYVYLLVSPLVDMLTSLAVRAGMTGLTMGVLARAAFVAAMVFYVLFLYKGQHKGKLRVAVILTSLYGVLYLANTVAVNGLGVLMENAKMFLRVYYFVYVLLGLYALYEEHRILVSDKMLTIVFCIYSTSIFLAAITGTSFPTYELLDIGYCGWFYAGNEIGAIVAILSGITLLYGFTHPKYFWIPILGLVAFSSTYIGTKVPFLAIVAIAALLFLFWLIKQLVRKPEEAKKKIVKYGALLLCIAVLYSIGSPIQQNAGVVQDRFDNIVESTPPTEPDNGEENTNEDQFMAVTDWLLSGRLSSIQNVVKRYAQGSWMDKLFGIGYNFKVDGKWNSDVVEMDFIAICLKHGIVGLAVFMAPLIYFAVICIIRLFKALRKFWELEAAFTYTYAILIGLGCALVAGHVLVAPAVSIYIAICTVKLYAYLTNFEEMQKTEKAV